MSYSYNLSINSYQHSNHRHFVAYRRSNRFTIKEPYFSQIAKGEKSVEGRINSGAFQKFQPGDKITFFNPHTRLSETQVNCIIKSKKIYENFRSMLEEEGLEKCLPGVKSLHEGVRIYESIPGFAERAKLNGVVALRIELEPKRVHVHFQDRVHKEINDKTIEVRPDKVHSESSNKRTRQPDLDSDYDNKNRYDRHQPSNDKRMRRYSED